MAPVKIGYWNIRGYQQPIRLLLTHAGVEYEDRRYKLGDGMDRSDWLNEKFTLGLDFPNIPYCIDGDVKLSQTFAILKYLGRKYGLAPKTEKEQIRVDLVEAEAMDMRTKWGQLCYAPEPKFSEDKPEFLKNLQIKLKEISNFLGAHPYFAGDNLTYIDFLLYELFDQHSLLEPTALDAFQNLKDFHSRIQSLDKVAAYLKSDKCIKYPLNGPVATFGGK